MAVRTSRAFSPLVLLCAVVVFVLSAGRGIDITDEPYYLLHFEYWSSLRFHLSLFGGYLDVPFRVLHGNIEALRVFGLALLVASGGAFAHSLQRFYGDRSERHVGETLSVTTCGMTCSLMYYAVHGTLRVPSYNTLTLAYMLLATACLLEYVRTPGTTRSRTGWSLAYGTLLSMAAFAKPTSALALLPCHGLLLLFYMRTEVARRVALLVTASFVGAAVNLAWIQLRFPQWYLTVVGGVKLSRILETRDPVVALTELPGAIAVGFVRQASFLAPLALAATIAIVLARNGNRRLLPLVIPLLMVGMAWQMSSSSADDSWLVVVAFHATVLWAIDYFTREQTRFTRHDLEVMVLGTVLFVLPIAYSIGTNNALIAHSRMASVFPLTLCVLLLLTLRSRVVLTPFAFRVSLALIGTPVLIWQLRPWVEVSHTYRLRTALQDQVARFPSGSRFASVRSDTATRNDLLRISELLSAAGFRQGNAILDFTGDSPGLIYAVGGRPVGVAWLLGGYPGSTSATAFMLSKIDAEVLKSAWIISSANNPRRIEEWETLLATRTGGACFVAAGQFVFRKPYGMTANETNSVDSLSFWRPRSQCGPSPSASPSE